MGACYVLGVSFLKYSLLKYKKMITLENYIEAKAIVLQFQQQTVEKLLLNLSEENGETIQELVDFIKLFEFYSPTFEYMS